MLYAAESISEMSCNQVVIDSATYAQVQYAFTYISLCCFVGLMQPSSTSLLRIYSVAPEATISQKPTVTVSEGDPAVVMCTATGVPFPNISWYLDGVLLADEDSTETPDVTLFSITSDLVLSSVMRESSFATITCTVSNGVGANSSDSTQLIVLCKLFVLLVISN